MLRRSLTMIVLGELVARGSYVHLQPQTYVHLQPQSYVHPQTYVHLQSYVHLQPYVHPQTYVHPQSYVHLPNRATCFIDPGSRAPMGPYGRATQKAVRTRARARFAFRVARAVRIASATQLLQR